MGKQLKLTIHLSVPHVLQLMQTYTVLLWLALWEKNNFITSALKVQKNNRKPIKGEIPCFFG